MRILSPKQRARIEKKQKRMAALEEIIKLNDRDGRKKIPDKTDDSSLCSKNLQYTPATTPKAKRKKIKYNEIETEKSVHDNMQYENSLPKSKQPMELENKMKNVEDLQTTYIQIKKNVNERIKNRSRYKPEIRLNLFGEMAQLSLNCSERTPIFLTDIQHLIMAALLGSDAPCSPARWCVLEKRNQITHTIVLVLEGISLYHYSSYESKFKETSSLFDYKLEVVLPPHQDGQIIDELACVPLTHCNRNDLIEKYGSLEVAIESTQNSLPLMNTLFRVMDNDDDQLGNLKYRQSTNSKYNEEVIPRTQLLLSALQMVDEGYPLPLRGELANRYKDFVFTKDCYKPVTAKSLMFGLDCEMCRTSAGVNELTRISIVDETCTTIYETLVRPKNKIVDYLTPFSGITDEMMINVTKTLADVQNDVRELLPADAILVGQSLHSDLLAMRMMHPYVIDTSVIFNLSGQRRLKSKLQTLSYEFLGEKIQVNPLGHDPIEDALASIKLTKLKLIKGLYFGDEVFIARKRATAMEKKHYTTGSNNTAQKQNKDKKDISTTFIISAEANNTSKFKTSELLHTDSPKISFHNAESNKMAIRKTRDLSITSALTITHLKIQSQNLELTKIEKTLAKMDRWIASTWQSIAPKGLFVVLMGGVPGTTSGVALMKIKKSNHNTSNSNSSQVE